jgi:hypothetical protein
MFALTICLSLSIPHFAKATTIAYDGFSVHLLHEVYLDEATAPMRVTADLSTLEWPLNEIAPLLLEAVRHGDLRSIRAALPALVLLGPETLPAAFEALHLHRDEAWGVTDEALILLHCDRLAEVPQLRAKYDACTRRNLRMLPLMEAAVKGESAIGKSLALYHLDRMGLPPEQLVLSLREALKNDHPLVIAIALRIADDMAEDGLLEVNNLVRVETLQRLLENSMNCSQDWRDYVKNLLSWFGPWADPLMSELRPGAAWQDLLAQANSAREQRGRHQTEKEAAASWGTPLAPSFIEELSQRDPDMAQLLWERKDDPAQLLESHAGRIVDLSRQMDDGAGAGGLQLLKHHNVELTRYMPELLWILGTEEYFQGEAVLSILEGTATEDERVTTALIGLHADAGSHQNRMLEELVRRAQRSPADARRLEEAYRASLSEPPETLPMRARDEKLYSLADVVALVPTVNRALLQEALASDNAYLRWSAARALRRAQGIDAPVAAPLLALLNDKVPEVVAEAAETLIALYPKDGPVAEALLSACASEDASAREAAITAASKLELHADAASRLTKCIVDHILRGYQENKSWTGLVRPRDFLSDDMLENPILRFEPGPLCEALCSRGDAAREVVELLLQSDDPVPQSDAIACLYYSNLDLHPFIPSLAQIVVDGGHLLEECTLLLKRAQAPPEAYVPLLVQHVLAKDEASMAAHDALKCLGTEASMAVPEVIAHYGFDHLSTEVTSEMNAWLGFELLAAIGADDPVAVNTLKSAHEYLQPKDKYWLYRALADVVRHHLEIE